MRHRQWNRFGATIVAVAIVGALALAVNPELRALILLTDSLGLDLLMLLWLTQLKVLLYASVPATTETIGSLCALAFCIGSGAMRTYPKALAWRPFDTLICPTLVFITYGVRCRVENP
jgi:hypothetical protein